MLNKEKSVVLFYPELIQVVNDDPMTMPVKEKRLEIVKKPFYVCSYKNVFQRTEKFNQFDNYDSIYNENRKILLKTRRCLSVAYKNFLKDNNVTYNFYTKFFVVFFTMKKLYV